MRITSRSPQGGRLQTIFFPAQPQPVMPSEISDEIVLVHPVLPPMTHFKEGKFFFSTTQSSAGAAVVSGPLVPTDRYWWVQFCHAFHNDTVTDRTLQLQFVDTVPNQVTIARDIAAVGSLIEFGMSRAIILPNDTRLRARVPAIGAAFKITLAFFFLELLHAEINPTA